MFKHQNKPHVKAQNKFLISIFYLTQKFFEKNLWIASPKKTHKWNFSAKPFPVKTVKQLFCESSIAATTFLLKITLKYFLESESKRL